MLKRLGILVLTLAAIVPVVLATSGCDALFGLDEILPQCTDANGDAADGKNAYQCVCDCAVPAGPAQHYLVGSADDAEELISTGAVLVNGLILELGATTTGPQKVGIRFPAIGIPRGSTITYADLRFTVSQATTGASVLQIRGQKSGDALPFTTASFDVSDPARRPPTDSVVPWTVPDWPTAGASGAAQLSPDLKTIVQEIIDLDGWRPGNALAFLVEGSGRRAAVSFDGGAAKSAILLIQYDTNQKILNDVFVCMPSSLNPNRDGSGDPRDTQLTDDCQLRVGATVSAMAAACGYPSTCDCKATPASTKLVCGCNDDCAETVLADDCSNFHPPTSVTATNAAGGTAICTAHSPLASALYGHRSRCEVTGDATVAVEDETETPAAAGVVELEGSLCPGPSCAVGMKYALDLGDVTFGNFFSSATFTDLASVGESLAGQEAALAGGAGRFAPGATLSTGRGSRGSQVRSVVTPNRDYLDVEADFTPGAATCRVHGALAGTVDPEAKRCQNDANVACTTDADCPGDCTQAGTCPCLPVGSSALNLAIDVSGSIVNQPPAANAGADQTAECSMGGAARAVLDGSASSDPDGNIADERWFRGTRAGPLAGVGPLAVVEQALGTQVSYVLRVIDGRGQSDEDTTSVEVVDTTAPEVACNTPDPSTITPPKAPISYQATAADVCDAQVTPALSDPKCFSITKKGRTVDRMADKNGCVVTLAGDTVTISDSGGVDDWVTWEASATDDSGNTGTTTCKIHVLAPAPK